MIKSYADGHNKVEDPGDRTEWILRLLYSPNNQGESMPLYGKTRLMKACFLLDRKLEEAFEISTDFEFRADKYGPFDPGVYVAIDHLVEENLIKDPQNVDEEDTDVFALTAEGTRVASELWNEIDGDVQRLCNWVKYERAMDSLGSLLAFVYNEYPDMTTKSVLK